MTLTRKPVENLPSVFDSPDPVLTDLLGVLKTHGVERREDQEQYLINLGNKTFTQSLRECYRDILRSQGLNEKKLAEMHKSNLEYLQPMWDPIVDKATGKKIGVEIYGHVLTPKAKKIQQDETKELDILMGHYPSKYENGGEDNGFGATLARELAPPLREMLENFLRDRRAIDVTQ